MDQQYQPQPNQRPPIVSPTSNPVNYSGNNRDGNGHKKVGPIIATLVIVLILIIAALYLFASRINKSAIPDDATMNAPASPSSSASDSATVRPVTGTSDDPQSLDNDLNASTNGLDQQNF